MEEVKLKTHLIITDTHHEYHMNWCGKVIDAKPLLINGLPHFIIIGSTGRIETNDFDMKQLEEKAKLLTRPRGREARTSDTARIYIKQIDGSEMLLGVMTHTFVREFSPMFDKFDCF